MLAIRWPATQPTRRQLRRGQVRRHDQKHAAAPDAERKDTTDRTHAAAPGAERKGATDQAHAAAPGAGCKDAAGPKRAAVPEARYKDAEDQKHLADKKRAAAPDVECEDVAGRKHSVAAAGAEHEDVMDISPDALGKASIPLRIAIIGAGFTGLLTAHGLKKVRPLSPPPRRVAPRHAHDAPPMGAGPTGRLQRGIEATVYEVKMSMDEPGSESLVFVDLWSSEIKSLLSRDTLDALRAGVGMQTEEEATVSARVVEAIPVFVSAVADTIPNVADRLPTRFNSRDLAALLAPGIDIRFGTRLQHYERDIDGGLSLRLRQPGDEDYYEVVDFLIGTDGYISAVRQGLVGASESIAIPVKWAIATVTLSYDSAEKAGYVACSNERLISVNTRNLACAIIRGVAAPVAAAARGVFPVLTLGPQAARASWIRKTLPTPSFISSSRGPAAP